ncbi:MAG TPA: class I SAM-dependent methyltransferase, partial [Kofleriaceae bacterium]|nr:class I SAM-dependent methyltransferase [Kofleriaceae bacterium]
TPPPPAPPTEQTNPGAAPAAAKPKPPPAPSARAAAAAVAAAAADPNQAKPRKRRGKPWFEEIFDEDYLRTLPFLTPQATQLEAQFVMDSLAVAPGTQVLDVGCGYGRHAMELAARGYHVVGLDSSLPLLLRGADEAQRRGLTINFVHGDMRDMAFDAQFDGAYCLFSTFGYFDDETNKKTAANICRALKPGARCVFELLNRDYMIGDLPLRVWWEGDGCVVLEEVDFNYFSSRIVSNRSVVFDDGRQLEQEISIRSFGLHELGKLLHSVGFRVVEVSGSMATKGRFFGAHSRDIVVVAERRVEKPGAAPATDPHGV